MKRLEEHRYFIMEITTIMAGLIPREFINDLLMRVDIVDLIDSHVPLKKAGNNYKARCPFHTEKSPSFSVNRNKQFYHCFGCGVSGNAVSFLMDFSNLNFIEAIEELASFVGIEVPREAATQQNFTPQDNLKELYDLLEQVAKFYAKQLRSTHPPAQPAIAYLKNRGLTGQIAKDFMLGYAEDKWQNLSAHFSTQLLLKAGLLVTHDNGKQYDRFRGRIMFPIKDKRGRIIGFGGRVLNDSPPKYLNSPETAVFSKGQHVYGLYELLKKNSKPERILIVEGYMDVIALAQYGISYAVATLGTATSKTHLDLLFRYTKNLIFCFDGDNAGKQAAWKATKEILPNVRDGRTVQIMLLPEGHDPDSLVRDKGMLNFEQYIDSSQALSNYFWDYFAKSVNLTTLEGQTQLMTEMQEYLGKLPSSLFKDGMLAKLQNLSEIAPKFYQMPSIRRPEFTSNSKEKNQKQLSPARVAIALLLQNPHLAENVIEKIPEWDEFEFPGLNVLKNLLHTILNYHPANTGALVEIYRGLVEEKIMRKLAGWEFPFSESGVTAEFTGAMDNLIAQAKQAKNTQLLAKVNSQSLSEFEKDQLIKNVTRQISVDSVEGFML